MDYRYHYWAKSTPLTEGDREFLADILAALEELPSAQLTRPEYGLGGGTHVSALGAYVQRHYGHFRPDEDFPEWEVFYEERKTLIDLLFGVGAGFSHGHDRWRVTRHWLQAALATGRAYDPAEFNQIVAPKGRVDREIPEDLVAAEYGDRGICRRWFRAVLRHKERELAYYDSDDFLYNTPTKVSAYELLIKEFGPQRRTKEEIIEAYPIIARVIDLAPPALFSSADRWEITRNWLAMAAQII